MMDISRKISLFQGEIEYYSYRNKKRFKCYFASSTAVGCVYIELPLDYDLADISIDNIMMNGIISAQALPFEAGDYDGDGIEDLMVKFKREDVANILAVSQQADIIVTGDVSGISFEGISAQIRQILRRKLYHGTSTRNRVSWGLVPCDEPGKKGRKNIS